MKRPSAQPVSALGTLVMVLLGSVLAVAIGGVYGRGDGQGAAGASDEPRPGSEPVAAAREPSADDAAADGDLDAFARALFDTQLMSWSAAAERASKPSAAGADPEPVGAPAEPASVLVASALAAAAEKIEPAIAAPASRPAPQVRAAPAPAASIAGRVLDPRGRAVAAATVRLCVRGRIWNEGRTADDGHYLLEKVRPGRYTIFANAAGYVTATGPNPVDIVDGSERDDVNIVLPEGGSIEGLVLDARNEPVEGARVALDRASVFGPLMTTTDAEGRFHLVGAPAGPSSLRVLDDRFLLAPPRPVDVPQLDDGSPGAACGVIVTLVPGAEIEGILRGLEDEPVEGLVELLDAKCRRVRVATTAQGEFRLEGLAPGQYQLVASTPTRSLAARDAVEIRAAERVAHDLALVEPGEIAGRVVDAGFPVEGATVIAQADALGIVRAVGTGADGAFRLNGLEDATYKITVRPPERYSLAAEPVLATVSRGVGPEALTFPVALGAALVGCVIAADGGPAAGANVTVYDLEGRVVGAIDADPAGCFRVPQLPAGTVDAYARLDSDLGRFPTYLQPGEEHRLVLTLAPAARIRGVIVRADGTPVAGATIEAHSIEQIVKRTAQSGADGSFEVGDLFRGHYILRARSDRLIAISELDLPESARVEGLTLVAR